MTNVNFINPNANFETTFIRWEKTFLEFISEKNPGEAFAITDNKIEFTIITDKHANDVSQPINAYFVGIPGLFFHTIVSRYGYGYIEQNNVFKTFQLMMKFIEKITQSYVFKGVTVEVDEKTHAVVGMDLVFALDSENVLIFNICISEE